MAGLTRPAPGPGARPRVQVCRAVPPEVVARLGAGLEVRTNDDDAVWPPAELAQRLADCDGALTTGSERIDAALLAACPRLRVCANMAVGHDNFDLPAMTGAGVLATNAPGVLTETTADMGFALLMAAARRITEAEAFLRAGHWDRWRHDMLLGQDIAGATLGILGMGRIGQAIARRGALGFGMRVIYHNRTRLDAGTEAACRAQWESKETLLRDSDHLVLVLPYSPAVHHVIGGAELSLMKPTAVLVNIGRGGLIDENALCDALEAGRLAGAGLDVFEGEPRVNPRLLAQRRVVLTPHIGSASRPTRVAMGLLAADNLLGALTGTGPLTPLNPEVLAA